MIDLKKAPKKSKDNKIIDGVCAGIANNFDVDPFWVRLAAIFLIPLSVGFAILVYIALMIIMDREK